MPEPAASVTYFCIVFIAGYTKSMFISATIMSFALAKREFVIEEMYSVGSILVNASLV